MMIDVELINSRKKTRLYLKVKKQKKFNGTISENKLDVFDEYQKF